MSLTPPLIAHKELRPLSMAPRLDLAFTRQEGEMDKAQALLIPAPLDPGYLFKRAANNPWFWLFLAASLCLHAALLLATSLWDRQNETAFGDEPIAVDFIMEQASPQPDQSNIEPTLNTPIEPLPEPIAVETKSEAILETPPLEPIVEPKLPEPLPREPLLLEPLPQEPLQQDTLAQTHPMPEPQILPIEEAVTARDEPPPLAQEEIKPDAPRLIEPLTAPAHIIPEPTPAPPTQATKPPPARKPPQAATPNRAPVLSEARLADFRSNLSHKLANAFRYPPLARERNKTGTVSVTFELDGNGNVTKASVVQSSGHEELDADALATIRRAAPFEPPPSGAPRSFTFPIVYRLR